MLKNRIYIALLFVFIFALISGCMNTAQFGAINTEKGLTGLVVTPGQCFTDAISNLVITNGNPFPNAQVYFYNAESGGFETTVVTSPDGVFKFENPSSSEYVIYAFREYPAGSGQFVVLKKAVIDVFPSEIANIGEINSYTTAQVIIWEQVNLLYGNNFTPFNPQNPTWSFNPADLILPVNDIPELIPSARLLSAVEKALEECRDPQNDSTVVKYAKEIAQAQFGAPDPEPIPISVPIVATPTPCVAPLPDVRFTVKVEGFIVTFTNLTENASRYEWDYGDGKRSSISRPSHSHIYRTPGSYLVTLTAYNECGDSMTMAQRVDNVGGIGNILDTSNGGSISF